MRQTGFFWDEKCFWHGGGDFALTMPLGGLVQPLASGGLPENPETKRRLKNLMDVTGLLDTLAVSSAEMASIDDLLLVHPAEFLDRFKAMSDAGGGVIGHNTPFLPGGFETARLSAGLAKAALEQVLRGTLKNAYALSRPPGHHCLPDTPMGFCLLANIAIAIEAARQKGLARRFVVLDWDVHHGNGTEAIFYDRDDVLTISIHQEGNYPLHSGGIEARGSGKGMGYNLNIPLPPGCGDQTYLAAMAQLVLPAIRSFGPDVIVVANGLDAGAFDPLGHMLVSADGFGQMTRQLMALADEICDSRLVMVHEGGYSEAYVPFCGHAVISALAGDEITAPDPLATVVAARQPSARAQEFHQTCITDYANFLKPAQLGSSAH